MKHQILSMPRGCFKAEGREWYVQHDAAVIAQSSAMKAFVQVFYFFRKEIPQKPFLKIFKAK
jgi:hypothetical protein